MLTGAAIATRSSLPGGPRALTLRGQMRTVSAAEIACAVAAATAQLNVQAQPWVWRQPTTERKLRRKFVYRHYRTFHTAVQASVVVVIDPARVRAGRS
jgi:hypothetical protein